MKISIIVANAALAVFVPALANAQQAPTGEKAYLQQSVPSVENAFELTVGTGYTQGFGMLQSGVGMPSVAKAGLGIDLGVGYRVAPRWSLTIGGQYQELDAQRATGARGVAMAFSAAYHIDPNVRLDPWVELGGGYRMLWETTSVANAPSLLTHGLELARARIGFDVRVSPEVAISPVIGADATVFLWQDATTNSAISSPTVSTFIFGGLQGRMDIGGTKVGTATITSATQE